MKVCVKSIFRARQNMEMNSMFRAGARERKAREEARKAAEAAAEAAEQRRLEQLRVEQNLSLVNLVWNFVIINNLNFRYLK